MGRTINVTDVLLLVEALELLEGFRRPSWLEMPGINVLNIQILTGLPAQAVQHGIIIRTAMMFVTSWLLSIASEEMSPSRAIRNPMSAFTSIS